MPRKPDPTLETRILNAARKLWIRGGDNALSMREVARAAKTNTPAIYRRFRNRKDILRALLRQIQEDLYQFLQLCTSPEELAQRVFEFAMTHQREYELVTAGLISRMNEPQPNYDFVKRQTAKWLGGSPEEHTRLVLAIWTVVHGTALLLITKTVPKEGEAALRSVFPATIEVLVKNRIALSGKA
jgi:AcrR family transcriptional regulator